MNLISEASSRNNKVYFLDPMHQVHNNTNDFGWQPIGAKGTKQVKANTGRRRLNIIGALDPITLLPLIILTESNCNKEFMISYLTYIREQNLSVNKIYVILDNAGYNRAYEVQNIAEELGIVLIYLPPYCPNLNLIERLWKFFKRKVMKNQYYKTFEEFSYNLSLFFANYTEFMPELKSLLTLNFGIIKAY